MADLVEIPEGWSEVKYETSDGYRALWACNDEPIAIDVEANVQGRDIGYTAVVYQQLEHEGLSTEIQSHARMADNRQEIEELVVEFMHEVNDGQHILRVLDHELWEEFVQFYCINEDAMPGEITAAELIEGLDNDQFDNQIDDVPDDVDPREYADEIMTIDVFPRHKTEVDGYTES